LCLFFCFVGGFCGVCLGFLGVFMFCVVSGV
jgi:hypothetical protein